MPKYIVQWEVPIDDAHSPEEAARQAEEFQRNPFTAVSMVEVITCDDHGEPLPGEVLLVDLDGDLSDTTDSRDDGPQI